MNYSALGKTLGAVLGEEAVRSLARMARRAAEVAVEGYAESLEAIEVSVERPKALLFADSVVVRRRFRVSGSSTLEDERHQLVIQDLRVDAIIGLHPHEREEEQRLAVDIEVDMMRVPDELVESGNGFDYKSLGRFAYDVSPVPMRGGSRIDLAWQYLRKSSFKTIEAMGYHTAHELLQRIPAQPFAPRDTPHSTTYLEADNINLTLRIKKPSAIAFAAHPTFTITRCLADYTAETHAEETPSTLVPPLKGPSSPSLNTDTAPHLGLGDPIVAYIAIGTNLGDRLRNIHDALTALPRISEESIGGASEEQRFLRVTRCSQLYESAPMYVLDQPEFINGAIQVSCGRKGEDGEADVFCRSRPISAPYHSSGI